MKIKLEDTSYGETRTLEINNANSGDLALIIEYLFAYSLELQRRIQTSEATDYAHTLIWQAKVKKINQLKAKYNKFIRFIQDVNEEENSL